MKQIDQDPEPVLTREATQAIRAIPALLVACALLAGPFSIAVFVFMEGAFWLKNGVFANYNLAMYSPPIAAGDYQGLQQIVWWVWHGWIGLPIAIATVVVWMVAYFIARVLQQ